MPNPNDLSNFDVTRVPFYTNDVQRVVPINSTGQPPSMEGGNEWLYPSSTRTHPVPNPLYRDGGPLPRFIPADMAQMLARLLRK